MTLQLPCVLGLLFLIAPQVAYRHFTRVPSPRTVKNDYTSSPYPNHPPSGTLNAMASQGRRFV
jgi:hypothetical protein